jgi:hypothetical protein
MDKLKEYLLRHKADLDVDSPASDTWENMGSKMSDESDQPGFATKPGFSTWVVRYAVAACVIALAGAGLWLVIKNNKAPSDTAKQDSPTIKREPAPGKEKIESTLGNEENTLRQEGNTPGKDIARHTSKPKQARHKARSQKPSEVSDEIDIIDKSYSKLIDFELRKLRTTPLYAENSSYFSFYVEQFKQMDQDEQAVRNDIKTYGLTNEFLEQLINVYQQKLNVLKNLQTEINKMNNKVRGKQTPSEKAEVHYLNI